MAAIQGTPMDYGLRVRTHTSGLEITGAGKLRTGTIMKVSYSGTISETVVFDSDPKIIEENFRLTERFLSDLGDPPTHEKRGRVIWSGVPSSQITSLLDEFRTHKNAPKVNGRMIANFIRKKNADGNLESWTVVLVTGGDGALTEIKPAGQINLTDRSIISSDALRYSIRRLISPADEKLDLDEDELKASKSDTKSNWELADPKTRGQVPTEPSGFSIRRFRSTKRGLLLIYPIRLLSEKVPVCTGSPHPVIGIALSFPSAGLGIDDGVEYRVNNVYWEQEFELK